LVFTLHWIGRVADLEGVEVESERVGGGRVRHGSRSTASALWGACRSGAWEITTLSVWIRSKPTSFPRSLPKAMSLANKLSITDLVLKDKHVLIRVDFNVPMQDGKITNPAVCASC